MRNARHDVPEDRLLDLGGQPSRIDIGCIFARPEDTIATARRAHCQRQVRRLAVTHGRRQLQAAEHAVDHRHRLAGSVDPHRPAEQPVVDAGRIGRGYAGRRRMVMNLWTASGSFVKAGVLERCKCQLEPFLGLRRAEPETRGEVPYGLVAPDAVAQAEPDEGRRRIEREEALAGCVVDDRASLDRMEGCLPGKPAQTIRVHRRRPCEGFR